MILSNVFRGKPTRWSGLTAAARDSMSILTADNHFLTISGISDRVSQSLADQSSRSSGERDEPCLTSYQHFTREMKGEMVQANHHVEHAWPKRLVEYRD
jgi:transketolase C-terminal domain/subunit